MVDVEAVYAQGALFPDGRFDSYLSEGSQQSCLWLHEPGGGGLDFYFARHRAAQRFVQWCAQRVPARAKESAKLVSQDYSNNTARVKHTTHVELVPVCKGDLVRLPRKVAAGLGWKPRAGAGDGGLAAQKPSKITPHAALHSPSFDIIWYISRRPSSVGGTGKPVRASSSKFVMRIVGVGGVCCAHLPLDHTHVWRSRLMPPIRSML